jgi:rhamnose utilization protein RhaD (predicted bifunctional aldolase and dehydrogenase)
LAVSAPAQIALCSAKHKTETQRLREFSACLGNNPLLVQGSNGNTSIKIDGRLWIKASGKWLADATAEDIFVSAGIAQARQSVRNIPQDTLSGELNARSAHPNKPTSGLRPSVETPMHAVIPHRVVVHVHSIHAIAWAIRLDGEKQLIVRLRGLPWKWIPYAPSGVALAREVEQVFAADPDLDVLVLGNHGLVICGNDCSSVADLLIEVERRLAIPARTFQRPDYAGLQLVRRSLGWAFPRNEMIHALEMDEVSRAILRNGTLYPCQALYLGNKISSPAVAPDAPQRPALNSSCFVPIEKMGVLVDSTATETELATLTALTEVTLRIPKCAPIRYLSEAEICGVMATGAK